MVVWSRAYPHTHSQTFERTATEKRCINETVNCDRARKLTGRCDYIIVSRDEQFYTRVFWAFLATRFRDVRFFVVLMLCVCCSGTAGVTVSTASAQASFIISYTRTNTRNTWNTYYIYYIYCQRTTGTDFAPIYRGLAWFSWSFRPRQTAGKRDWTGVSERVIYAAFIMLAGDVYFRVCVNMHNYLCYILYTHGDKS